LKQGLVSVILPVHNQEDHIGQVVEEYQAALDLLRTPYELLLVVNASRDKSGAICARLAKRDRRVRVLNSELGGWGRAVKLGLSSARGSLLCYTNSSRTSAADLACLVLRSILAPGRAFKADRRLRESPLRRLGSLLFNLECRLLLGTRSRDINGTPKAFPRAFSGLLGLQRDDDLIDAEFNAICARNQYPLSEVPIFSSRRHGGRSTTRFKSALKMYFGAFTLLRGLP
jgi:glycosyltransferase involved in cell wall biosynthesis